jgi:hypothetical protein
MQSSLGYAIGGAEELSLKYPSLSLKGGKNTLKKFVYSPKVFFDIAVAEYETCSPIWKRT